MVICRFKRVGHGQALVRERQMISAARFFPPIMRMSQGWPICGVGGQGIAMAKSLSSGTAEVSNSQGA